jgi:hypothetical protein
MGSEGLKHRKGIAESHIGISNDTLMTEPKKDGWTVISRKDD